MKILPIIQSLYESLLIEANLINGKDPYNGVSLAAFLEQFTSGLNTPEAKQMFVKKLSRLLMADERFLYAVRELPPDAPTWAQQSMEAGDLVFFQPSPELKDNIENLSHYVAALEQDMVGADANAKAIAVREMQGFPKAETLDLLLTKVQEYFARGAEKTEASDTEGMKAVLEAPGGYVWYKLETPKAFYREGQTLSNCIGRNYTAENTKATNTTIYVLRDRANNSIVATRIKDGEMQEVKGKGNTPPIPRYMPAVQKLINTFNITLASGGKSDVGNSGYYYYEGILYSKPQAIAKLMSIDPLFKLPGTSVQVGRVVSKVPELIAHLYTKGYYLLSAPTIYQAQVDDGDPLVAIQVEDGKVKTIIRLISTSAVKEAEEPNPTDSSKVLPAMITGLVQRGDVKALSDEVIRELYFQDGARWNEKTKQFTYHKDAVARQHKPKQKGAYTLDVYEGDEAKQLVKHLVAGGGSADAENVKAVYAATVRKATEEVGKQTDKILIVVEHNDGSTALFSVRGGNISIRQAGYTRQGAHWSSELVRDGKTVNTLMALANEQGFKLPKRFQVAHGLSYREGQYINMPELTPTEVPGDPSAVVYDLSTLDPMDKATVLARAVSMNDTKPHLTPFTPAFKFRGVTKGLEQTLAGKGKDDDSFYTDHSGARDRDLPNVSDKDINKWTDETFGTAKPTAVYRVNIKYGTDKGGKVSMVVAGKTVAAIDAETLDHTWQSRGDYQVVSDQLNKFATANGLKFDRSAIKKSPQLRVGKDGMLVPAEVQAKSRMETRLSRDKSVTGRVGDVPFADGTTARKMSQDDYGTWSAHGIKRNVSGTPWEIVKDDGTVIGVAVVSKDGKISGTYSNPSGEPGAGRTFEVGGRELPVVSAPNLEITPYVKRLATEFGWSVSDKYDIIAPNSSMGKLLMLANRRRSNTVNLNREYNSLAAVAEGAPRYKKSNQYYNIAQPLKTARLVTIRDGDNTAYFDSMTLTPAGERVANQLAHGDEVRWSTLSSAPPAELSDEYARPAEPAPVERVAREPGVQRPAGERPARTRLEGGGSKADMAMTRFRELAAANNGTMPTRSEFIALLLQPPFNMTPAGASTYQYNVKAKYLRDRGDINEHFTFIDFLTYIA